MSKDIVASGEAAEMKLGPADPMYAEPGADTAGEVYRCLGANTLLTNPLQAKKDPIERIMSAATHYKVQRITLAAIPNRAHPRYWGSKTTRAKKPL